MFKTIQEQITYLCTATSTSPCSLPSMKPSTSAMASSMASRCSWITAMIPWTALPWSSAVSHTSMTFSASRSMKHSVSVSPSIIIMKGSMTMKYHNISFTNWTVPVLHVASSAKLPLALSTDIPAAIRAASITSWQRPWQSVPIGTLGHWWQDHPRYSQQSEFLNILIQFSRLWHSCAYSLISKEPPALLK